MRDGDRRPHLERGDDRLGVLVGRLGAPTIGPRSLGCRSPGRSRSRSRSCRRRTRIRIRSPTLAAATGTCRHMTRRSLPCLDHPANKAGRTEVRAAGRGPWPRRRRPRRVTVTAHGAPHDLPRAFDDTMQNVTPDGQDGSETCVLTDPEPLRRVLVQVVADPGCYVARVDPQEPLVIESRAFGRQCADEVAVGAEVRCTSSAPMVPAGSRARSCTPRAGPRCRVGCPPPPGARISVAERSFFVVEFDPGRLARPGRPGGHGSGSPWRSAPTSAPPGPSPSPSLSTRGSCGGRGVPAVSGCCCRLRLGGPDRRSCGLPGRPRHTIGRAGGRGVRDAR